MRDREPPLTIYVGHYRHVVRPDYYIMLPKNGEKMNQSQEDSSELQAISGTGFNFKPVQASRRAVSDLLQEPLALLQQNTLLPI